VATVAHVVVGADSVVLRDGTSSRTGTVIGLDADHEVALVRTRGRFDGHVFELAGSQPDVGADVAAIGYPLAGPRSLSRGTVSGLDRSGQVEGTAVTGLIQTDAALNLGNSGGPLVDRDGRVVGLVDAKVDGADGIGFAVPATTAAGLFASWRATLTLLQPPRQGARTRSDRRT
jgi:serine protease Do